MHAGRKTGRAGNGQRCHDSKKHRSDGERQPQDASRDESEQGSRSHQHTSNLQCGHAGLARHAPILAKAREAHVKTGIRHQLVPCRLLPVACFYSFFAASFAKYVTMKSAPARRMLSSDSSIARSRSSQPFSNAACSIEYSPETWYAPMGTSTRSRAARTTSR